MRKQVTVFLMLSWQRGDCPLPPSLHRWRRQGCSPGDVDEERHDVTVVTVLNACLHLLQFCHITLVRVAPSLKSTGKTLAWISNTHHASLFWNPPSNICHDWLWYLPWLVLLSAINGYTTQGALLIYDHLCAEIDLKFHDVRALRKNRESLITNAVEAISLCKKWIKFGY